MEARPPIPAETKRRVLVEAGHRCAIPTCRYIETEIHHIVPWATCQAHEYDNLIALCPNCHNRADRGEIDRKALRLYKFNLRMAHDKYSQVELDLMFGLYQAGPGKSAQWLPVMMVLLRRALEAELLTVHQNPHGTAHSFGLQTSPDFVSLSEKGRAFIEELGLHEI